MEAREWLKKIHWSPLFWSIFCVMVMVPIIIASGYCVLYADDFSHSNGVGVFGGSIWELFRASLSYCKRMYLTWQGTYTSMFLQAFLSPLNGYGYIQLRVVMMANALLFIISFVLLMHALCKVFGVSKRYQYPIYAVCILGVFGFTAWAEVFFWFSGAVSYSFPFSLMMLGLTIMLYEKIRGGGVCSGRSIDVFGIGRYA